MPVKTEIAASGTRLVLPVPALKTCLELLKPVTWFAPVWAFFCGVISAGQPVAGHWLTILIGLVLAGPMVCGTSQAVNDWFDRGVDTINEPARPIPSGRMPGSWGLYIGIIWTVLSLLLATGLGRWGFGAAAVALAMAWGYSAPPLRLKRNGWWGNAAVAICYEGVPWFTGAAIMADRLPASNVLILALLYSSGAHGIMTLNDFKSVKGDRALGVRSLPVMLGEAAAAKLACVVMILPQLGVIFMMLLSHHPAAGVVVTGLVSAQICLMVDLLDAPRDRAVWYNSTGTTLYVTGMLICAFALGGA